MCLNLSSRTLLRKAHSQMFFVSGAQRSSPFFVSAQEGGRLPWISFVWPPVISAAKNEPSVKDKSQHLNIPNYQGGTHFCCHSEAGTNPDTLSIWWTRCQQISRQAVPRQRQPRGRLQKTVLCLPCPPESSSRCCWLSLCFRARKGKA